MGFAAHARVASLLLIPILGCFGIQGSLEVVHPVEERQGTSRIHRVHEPALCDLGAFRGEIHKSHYCPHLNTFAPTSEIAPPFNPSGIRMDGPTAYTSRRVRPAQGISGRGPPPYLIT